MKKKFKLFITLITAVLIITSACDRDEGEQFPLHESDSFSIDISFGKLSTRALTTEDGDADGAFNENKINTLDIFFYEGAILKWRVTSPVYDDATKQATSSHIPNPFIKSIGTNVITSIRPTVQKIGATPKSPLRTGIQPGQAS